MWLDSRFRKVMVTGGENFYRGFWLSLTNHMAAATAIQLGDASLLTILPRLAHNGLTN